MSSTTRLRLFRASPASTSLAARLAAYAAAVDRRLPHHLPPEGSGEDVLSAAVRAAVLSPGKRLRPALVLLAAEAFGRRDEAVLEVACVPELVHAASLALDDLPCMDDAEVRRGEPTLHRRFGEAVAILAAFALLARAQALLPRALAAAGVAPAHRRQLEQRFAEVIEALCRGQVADLALAGRGGGLDVLERIHAQKTGALFEYATLLGAVAAGARGRALEAVLAYARNLGLAFQVSDDLLDARGNAAAMGKAAGRDAALGRATFVSVFGLEGAESLCDELVQAARRALLPLGSAAHWLAELAEYVRHRTA